MKKPKYCFRLLTVASISLILSSCFLFYEDSTNDSFFIYKFDGQDYSNNVPVELSKDKTKVTSIPGSLTSQWPVKLINGYYLNGTMGKNSGYISMTIEDYNENYAEIGIDSLNKLIVERDPYLEFYRGNLDNFWIEEGGYYSIDTTAINNLIRKEKLEDYFERLQL